MKQGTAQSNTVTVAGGGELKRSLIIIKACATPLNGTVIRSHGPNERRKQINGAVEIIKHGPRDSVRENRDNIVDSEGDFERVN